MQRVLNIEVDADMANLGQVRDFVEEEAQSAGLSSDQKGELVLAVDEAVTNVMMHGCPQGGCNIELEAKLDDRAFSILIRDNGQLFDPTKRHDPNLNISPFEQEQAGGFGVYLIKHLVDQISYQVTSQGCNELTLLKRLDGKTVEA
jgi:serine/threonine-protein kinase RsbW